MGHMDYGMNDVPCNYFVLHIFLDIYVKKIPDSMTHVEVKAATKTNSSGIKLINRITKNKLK